MDWGWYVQVGHSSVLDWHMDGQVELLKGAEEDQVE
jgi:hypothetical protein